METQILDFITNHILLTAGWFLSGLLLLVSIKKGAVAAVSSQQLVNMVNRQEALIVDIRSAEEFSKGHITAAKNIQLSKLNNQLSELEKWKNKPIIVVCNAGIQANGASTLLTKQGFEQVYKLQGGMQSWLSDSLPVTKS